MKRRWFSVQFANEKGNKILDRYPEVAAQFSLQ